MKTLMVIIIGILSTSVFAQGYPEAMTEFHTIRPYRTVPVLPPVAPVVFLSRPYREITILPPVASVVFSPRHHRLPDVYDTCRSINPYQRDSRLFNDYQRICIQFQNERIRHYRH